MSRPPHNRNLNNNDRSLMLVGLAHIAPFQHVPMKSFPFVGRAREQEYARSQLARSGVVAITGIAGSGKTTLTAAVLRETEAHTVWIEIWPGLNDQVEAFLWQLAQPLAEMSPHIWRALHQVQQSQWGYPPLVRLHMILDAYVALGKQITICVDRVEHLDGPALESALAELCEYVAHMQRDRLNLIVAGRTLPYSLRAYAIPALQGLEAQMISLWAQQLTIHLDAQAIATLHRQTDGLPQLIGLVFRAMFNSIGGFAVDPIMSYQEVRFFVAELLSHFSDEEQELLAALARGQGINIPLSVNALRHLDHLERNHVTIVSSPNGVRVHPIIQHFYQFYGA
jgi:ATP/maltotriose-dependent transcriptional regulator MalT